jgi:hypothetical protein
MKYLRKYNESKSNYIFEDSKYDLDKLDYVKVRVQPKQISDVISFLLTNGFKYQPSNENNFEHFRNAKSDFYLMFSSGRLIDWDVIDSNIHYGMDEIKLEDLFKYEPDPDVMLEAYEDIDFKYLDKVSKEKNIDLTSNPITRSESIWKIEFKYREQDVTITWNKGSSISILKIGGKEFVYDIKLFREVNNCFYFNGKQKDPEVVFENLNVDDLSMTKAICTKDQLNDLIEYLYNNDYHLDGNSSRNFDFLYNRFYGGNKLMIYFEPNKGINCSSIIDMSAFPEYQEININDILYNKEKDPEITL